MKRALAAATKLAAPPSARQKLPLDRRDLQRVVQHLADEGPEYYIGVRDRGDAAAGLGWNVSVI